MFNECINNTLNLERYFVENVQGGPFAKSFPTDVMDKIIVEEHALQSSYEDGKNKEMKINSLLDELRAMV
ncbi:MAG: hypothetical protein HUK20_09050 [Fibrobacter sp.]|nr:hypothetical protein [Fibrobacter sp.]